MDRKQRATLWIAGLLIFAVALVYLVSLGTIQKSLDITATPTTTCSGGQITSISDAKLYTSDNLGGKKVVRVTFSTLPSAECLYIKLKAADINAKLSEGDKAKFQATNTILGDIRLLKEQKVYLINERTTEKFKTFSLSKLPNYDSIIYPCWDSLCDNHFDSIFSSPVWTAQLTNLSDRDKCYCASDGETGINGEFSISESFDWKVQIDLGTESPLVLSPGTLSGKIGDLAFAEWNGNWASNDNLGSITNRQAYKPYSDNQWRMTDLVWQDLNNKYSTIRQNLVDCDSASCLIKGMCNCNPYITSAFGFINEFNAKTSNKLNEWVQGNPIVKDASISSNKLIVNLNSAVVYPQFILDIDAAEVGVFITSGEPKVTCPSSITDCITSGTTKDVNFQVKNIGANSGSFTYSLTCNKGSQYLTPSPPQSISAGNTKSISARLGLTVPSGTETATCTFTATDSQSCRTSCKTDSCSFSYCSTHQSQCIKDTKSCEMGNTELWTCKADGTYEKIKCPQGCAFDNGEYKCMGGGGQNGTEACANCWNWLGYKIGMSEATLGCKISLWSKITDALFCPFYFLKLALILVAVIFALLFGQQFAEKTFRNIPFWATWVLAVIFAGAIGVLAYLFLEWYYVIPILIILVIIGVIANAIPGKSYVRGLLSKR